MPQVIKKYKCLYSSDDFVSLGPVPFQMVHLHVKCVMKHNLWSIQYWNICEENEFMRWTIIVMAFAWLNRASEMDVKVGIIVTNIFILQE